MTIHHLTQASTSFHLPSTEPAYAPSLPLEPIHGKIHFHPDIQDKVLHASVLWTVQSHVDTAQQINLDAKDIQIIRCFDIDSSEENDCTFHYDGNTMEIRWIRPIAKGKTRTVQIDYQVNSPIAGLYFGGPTPDMPNQGYWMATDHETTRARYWIPCVDHSNVRTTLDVFITHKKEHTAVSAGYLVQTEEISATTSKSHWKLDQRCPIYLLAIIVGEYERVDFPSLRDIPLSAFAPKGNSREDLYRAFAPTKELIEFAESLLGPLPWPKYFQFAAPGIGGAMENISLVSWDARFLFDENMHKDLGLLFDQINLHELAHTWFGDLIVCRDYAHVWLKESWATYFECVWFEHKFDKDMHHLELFYKRERYFSEVANRYSRPIMTRVFDTAWKMYDMHLYPGGAVRLHMLRDKIGDTAFWDATREYIQVYAEQVVESDDFRRVLEKHSGQSLAHFFDQWFNRAGYPKLSVKHQYFADSHVLRIQVEQSIVGGIKVNGKEELPFHLPVDIAIETTDGAWQTHRIHMDSFHQTLRVEINEQPKQIVIDPNCIAVAGIEFDPGLELNKRSLSHSPYLHGRIQAARNLVKAGSNLAMAEIAHVYGDQHYGVREQIVLALAKSKHLKTADMLISWLSTETHPAVLVAIVQTLASHPSKETAQALTTFIHQDNAPYRAVGNALVSLAQQGKHTDISLLIEFCSHNGWKHYLRDFAFQSLQHVESTEALEVLLQACVSKEQGYKAKVAACSALVGCAKKISKLAENKAKQTLVQALSDENHNVRLAAVHALQRLGHRDVIGDIEGTRSQLACQFDPDVTRAIEACRTGSEDSALQSLQKRFNELEEQHKKLEKHVQDIQSQLHLDNQKV